MKHVIAHNLGVDTARKVTDRAFAEYKRKYPAYEPELEWRTARKADVRFRASGIRLNGSVGLEPGAIELALDVPFFFRPFQKVAMEVIRREVERWIQLARGGQV
jgi:hypothetical protein